MNNLINKVAAIRLINGQLITCEHIEGLNYIQGTPSFYGVISNGVEMLIHREQVIELICQPGTLKEAA